MFIAGIYRYDNKESDVSLECAVSRMAGAMSARSEKHRFLRHENIVMTFAHLAEQGQKQPPSDSGDRKDDHLLEVVYAGAIFNTDHIKKELSLAKDASHEGVIKAAYRQWGTAFIRHIDGEFTVALFNKDDGSLFLARDRAGLKPLYYWADKGIFAFASEVKALLAWQKQRVINYPALHANMVFNSVFSREHLFKGIFELRAGHLLGSSINTGTGHSLYGTAHFCITKTGSVPYSLRQLRKGFLKRMRT